jgi:hypoxanthine phosphoribosyltransferase
MQLDYKKAQDILDKSSILYTKDEISKEVHRLAKAIEEDIKDDIPVFLSVMNGGLFFTSELLQNINSPFILDYIHASRYGGETFGASHITWYRQPKAEDIKGKNVYIIDDILDEGYTLVEIVRYLKSIGALSCKIVVLINKEIGKTKPIKADFVGLNAPNKFLFGCGMDIFGLYRQIPNICIYNK